MFSDSPGRKVNPPSHNLNRLERLKNAMIGECSCEIMSKSICLKAVFTAGEKLCANSASSLYGRETSGHIGQTTVSYEFEISCVYGEKTDESGR